MNIGQAMAIQEQYMNLSTSSRACVSARVLGTNLARVDFFEHKPAVSTKEYQKILAASWFFKDLESAIEVETK